MTTLTPGIRVKTPEGLPAPYDTATWHFAKSAGSFGRSLLVTNAADPVTLEIDQELVVARADEDRITAERASELAVAAKAAQRTLFEPLRAFA